MVVCSICDEIWEHVECHGFKDIYERDKKLCNDALFCCIRCFKADPSKPPSPQTIPTKPTVATTIHRAVVMNDDNLDDDADNLENEDAKQMELQTSKCIHIIQSITKLPTTESPPNAHNISYVASMHEACTLDNNIANDNHLTISFDLVCIG